MIALTYRTALNLLLSISEQTLIVHRSSMANCSRELTC